MNLALSTPVVYLYSIAIAAILIYLPFLVVSYARAQVGLDLAAPRAMFDKLPPYAQRATWAHQNSWETYTIFVAAALMAYITQLHSLIAIGSAIAFVVARFFYSVFYILNVPIARSLMFGIGSLACATLFVLSILQANSLIMP